MGLLMPLLVTPEDVILRMQLNSTLDGVVEVVSSAIRAAQVHVQAVLDGQLVRQSHDSKYFLDADAFSGLQPDGMFRLEVPSGFIRKDTPLVVTYGDKLKSTTQAVEPELVEVDYEKGYVLLDATYGDKYVQVRCDTGFEGGARPYSPLNVAAFDPAKLDYAVGDLVVINAVVYRCICLNNGAALAAPPSTEFWEPALIPVEKIPDNLYEAILAYVPSGLNAAQTTNRNEEAEPQYKTAADHSQMLLKPYMRLKGFTFRAIVSSSVA